MEGEALELTTRKQIPQLSIIMISNSPRQLILHKAGVPYIHFPPYTRSEALTLINASPPPLHLHPPLKHRTNPLLPDEQTLRKIYLQFTAAVYDALIAPTASTSIPIFRSTCAKLWPRFIWPYFSGQPPPGKAKSWDFGRLLVHGRTLFQGEGELALVERLWAATGGELDVRGVGRGGNVTLRG